jgi:AraC-like DNA-binding protein
MRIQLPALPADPLADALQVLRPEGAMYTRSHLTAPWGMEVPPLEQMLMLHAVTSGSCWFQSAGYEPRRLQRGDVALVPRGAGHSLVANLGDRTTPLFELPREPVSERYEVIRAGGGDALTELVCATVQFKHPAARRLMSVLPPIVCIDSASPMHSEWLHSTLALMAVEANAVRVGGEAVITRLADVLVIQAIRSWIENDPAAQTGWLRALGDKQIGRAIAMIHRDPAKDWTIAGLADAVAMSRSSFAAKFTELAGVSVMQYVTQWRMQVAYTLLQEPDARVSDLAIRLGYQSEAAFSRAFKRYAGVSPSEARDGSHGHIPHH